MEIKRGQIYYADLSPVVGSEQGGYRPVLIVQNDMGNKSAPTTIVAAITSIQSKKRIPTHITLSGALIKDSCILAEQLRTIDKQRLKCLIAEIDESLMHKVDKAIMKSLGV
jgi:mRNA interferase MazF